MKPIKLSIQAFGPFADKQTLDFSQLGNNPLFLINGSTGSGKSTLLDAMCFALYGKTSGAEREASQMRCDHASADTITEIEFTFSIKDKIYKVQRQPMQERAKARGEGTTIQQTEASLWLIEDDSEQLLVSKSAQQVNQQLQQIIGLDSEQFRQVMVLPQGKFREFLLADSNQRERIFSTLFQTHIYQRLEEKLKSNAQALKNDNERIKDTKAELFNSLACEDSQTLRQALKAAKAQVESTEKLRDEAQKNRDALQTQRDTAEALHKEFEELSHQQAELKKLEAQANEQQALKATLSQCANALEVKPIYENYQKAQATQEQAKHEVATAEQALTQQVNACEELEALLNQSSEQEKALPQKKTLLDNLKQKLPVLTEWQKAQSVIQEQQQLFSKTQQDENATSESLTAITEELTKKPRTTQPHNWTATTTGTAGN